MYEAGRPGVFLRDGVAARWLALLLAGVVLGGVLAGGGAALAERALVRAVTGLLGAYGEYDLIVHLRADRGEPAATALQELVKARMPGTRLRAGPAVAGQLNYFLALPEELVRPGFLEGLGSLLATLPGYNGYTLLLQPTLRVSGLHPAVRERLEASLAARPDVRFTWHRGDDLVIHLRSATDSARVSTAVKGLLQQYHLVDVRFPLTYGRAPRELEEQLRKAVGHVVGPGRVAVVPPPSPGDDLTALTRSLEEMRDFLLAYAAEIELVPAGGAPLRAGERLVAPRQEEPAGEALTPGSPLPPEGERITLEVLDAGPAGGRAVVVDGELPQRLHTLLPVYRVEEGRVGKRAATAYVTNRRAELVAALDRGAAFIDQLTSFSRQARAGAARMGLNLTALEDALDTLARIETGVAGLLGDPGGDEGQLVHLAGRLLLQRLLGPGADRQVAPALAGPGHGQEGAASGRGLAEARRELARLNRDLERLGALDLESLQAEIGRLRSALPRLSEAEVGRSIRLVDGYLAGKVIPGDRAQLLITAGRVDRARVREAIRGALPQPSAAVFFLPAGDIAPDARTELLSVLDRARHTVAGLLALTFTVLTLILDHATFVAVWRRVAGAAPAGVRGALWRAAPLVAGAGAGAVLAGGMSWIAQGEPPALLPTVLAGALLGLGAAFLAPRLAAVSEPEFTAGEALGLTYGQILQEIVIPAGRPGLLGLLNRAVQAFR